MDADPAEAGAALHLRPKGPSQPQTRCRTARAGCPRHSGRDARATSETSAFTFVSRNLRRTHVAVVATALVD
jgi:hypothetical protein